MIRLYPETRKRGLENLHFHPIFLAGAYNFLLYFAKVLFTEVSFRCKKGQNFTVFAIFTNILRYGN